LDCGGGFADAIYWLPWHRLKLRLILRAECDQIVRFWRVFTSGARDFPAATAYQRTEARIAGEGWCSAWAPAFQAKFSTLGNLCDPREDMHEDSSSGPTKRGGIGI